jgi:hypothetical protein
MSKNPVLKCYRDLLKAQQFVFKGDTHTLDLARQQTRKMFMKQVEKEEVKQLVAQGHEMAQLLRRNVVQAVKVQDNRYRITLDPNVHEMGDNDVDFAHKKRPEDMPNGYLEKLAAMNPVKCGDVLGAQKAIEQWKSSPR